MKAALERKKKNKQTVHICAMARSLCHQNTSPLFLVKPWGKKIELFSSSMVKLCFQHDKINTCGLTDKVGCAILLY